MREILIIRSVSFQQLDHNLPVIRGRFPDARFTLLTHEHGVKLAEKYNAIDQVVPYAYSEGFSYTRQAKGLKGVNFDEVIIPVANETGLGFFNVMLFALTFRTRERWICNLRSEFTRVTARDILLKGLLNIFYKALSICVVGLFCVTSIILLPLLFISITAREMKGS